MKVFDFGAFRNKMHIASGEKYIFHILFGAFHGTPRTQGIGPKVEYCRNQHDNRIRFNNLNQAHHMTNVFRILSALNLIKSVSKSISCFI